MIQAFSEESNLVEVGGGVSSVIEVASAAGPRGLSAYQIALLNGFVGSEQDWLASLAGGDISAHVNDPEPHPAYDDMVSLTLIYENGLI